MNPIFYYENMKPIASLCYKIIRPVSYKNGLNYHIRSLSTSINNNSFPYTLGLIKPDVYCDPLTVLQVQHIITQSGLRILQQCRIHWDTKQAGDFYSVHQGKFFYDRLVSYMSSGPFLAMILESSSSSITNSSADTNVISTWRNLIGPTHPVRAQVKAPNSLRGQFGLTDTRNSFHGSDSIDNAIEEIIYFFPEMKSKLDNVYNPSK